ncbi:hypothetical protein U1Q18_022805 [Sarracenia purpurea var. burkii]
MNMLKKFIDDIDAAIYTSRELYPSLLLFPAERKNAVPYEGSVAVSDIIKFIVDHGHNADNLVKENVLVGRRLHLWTHLSRLVITAIFAECFDVI